MPVAEENISDVTRDLEVVTLEEQCHILRQQVEVEYNEESTNIITALQKDLTAEKHEQQRLKLLSKFVVANIGTEEARPLRRKIGPLIVPSVEATQLEKIWNTEVSNTNIRTISSDGSMINADSDNIVMAFGVVDNTNSITRSVGGRTGGYASSTKAELMGLLAAIVAAPPEQNILVELDNQAVAILFKQM
ncbi:hypothetical protein BGZ76_007172, partial [Entomortierella beljakovae]